MSVLRNRRDRSRRSKRRLVPAVPFVALALLATAPVSAATYTWTGTFSPNWNSILNWSGGEVPTSATDTVLLFNSAGLGRTTSNNNLGTLTLNTLSFTAAGYTINGGSLRFAGTTPQLLQTVTGTNTVNSAVGLVGSVTANIQNASGNLVLGGIVSGSSTSTLNKTGSGTLTLTGAGSNVGNLTATSGTIALRNSGSITVTNATQLNVGTTLIADGTINTSTLTGGGNILLTNSGLALNQSDDSTFSGSLTTNTTAAAFTKTGAGTLTLSGSDCDINALIVSQGKIVLNDTGNFASSITNVGSNGALSFSGFNATLATTNLTGTGVLEAQTASTITLNLQGSSVFEGTITGAGGFTKLGNGTLTLTKAGSGVGTFRAESGVVALSSGATLSSRSGSIGGQSGVFVDGIGSTWTSSSLTVGASSTGTGLLNITNGGVVNNSGSGDVGISIGLGGGTGSVTVSGTGSKWNNSTLSIGSGGGSGTIAISNNGAVNANIIELGERGRITGNGGTLNTMALFGTGELRSDTNGLTLNFSDTSTFAGSITGNGTLTKIGAGTLTLTGSNHSGNMRLQEGGIVFSGATVSGSRLEAINGSNLRFTNDTTLNLGSTGQIRSGTGTNVVYDNARVNGGYLYGPGTHTVSSGGAIFTGTQIFSSARLTIGAPATMTALSNSGTIAVNSGVTLTLDGFQNQTGGSVTTANGSQLNVSDFVSDGRLTINGGSTARNNGFSPISLGGGSQTTIGSQAAPGGTLNTGGQNIDIAGGLLINNGTITGGGTLNINYGATVKGAGSFSGVSLVVGDGGRYSPGNSPGTMNAAGMTWATGGGMLWEINDADGVAGTAFDFTSLSGALNITSGTTANSQFIISLASLLPNNSPGALAKFNGSQDYSWTILNASGGIFGFSTSNVVLDTAGFFAYNPITPAPGTFSLAQVGNTIKLSYLSVPVVVPENNTGLLVLLGGAGGAAGMLWRARRQRILAA